jgi:hypothetical protein
MHGARAALAETAAEFGAVELKLIPEHVQQRGVCSGGDGVPLAVDGNDDGHGVLLLGNLLVNRPEMPDWRAFPGDCLYFSSARHCKKRLPRSVQRAARIKP